MRRPPEISKVKGAKNIPNVVSSSNERRLSSSSREKNGTAGNIKNAKPTSNERRLCGVAQPKKQQPSADKSDESGDKIHCSQDSLDNSKEQVQPARYPIVYPKKLTVATPRNFAVKKAAPPCVLCKDMDCLRLRLRVCQHIACVPCLLYYVQGQIQLKAKVGIRCPLATCAREIHENDLNAIFDEEEEGLDAIMETEHRQWLQFVHNKDSIILALGGSDPEIQEKIVKRCPMCKSIYQRRDGCNNVICPNLRCRTQFCWQCARPTNGFGHFTGGKECRLSFDDIERGVFIFRLAREVKTFGVAFGIPVVFMFLHFLFPILIFILFPTLVSIHYYKKSTSKTDFLTPAEWTLVILKIVFVVLISIPLSLLLCVCSVPSATGLFCLYLAFFFLKTAAITDKIFEKYDVFLPYAKALGLLHYKQMLKDARESKRIRKEIEEEELERAELEEGKLEVYEPAMRLP